MVNLSLAPVSSPMEKDNEATYITEFFGKVDNGDESAEMWRERFDELEFTSPTDSPKSLVTINRTNEEEAKAVQNLIRRYHDVFAVEVASTATSICGTY
jgi:hypothetical protein